MNRRLLSFILALLLVLSSAPLGLPAQALEDAGDTGAHNGYLFRLTEDAPQALSLLGEEEGLEPVAPRHRIYFAQDLETITAQYDMRYIEYIEPNGTTLELLDAPVNDPNYADQWQLQDAYLNMAKVYQPRSSGKVWDGSGVKIAVLDSGIVSDHPDLPGSGEFIGRNFVNTKTYGTTDVTDTYDNGHGTFVAGILVAKTNNNTGIAGMASGAQLLIYRVFVKNESSEYKYILAALEEAIAQGADVINMSFGDTSYDAAKELHPLLRAANEAGIILVAAGGNDARTASKAKWPRYPAGFDYVVGVGSGSRDGQTGYARSDFSNYYPQIDISAPGDLVYSTGHKESARYYASSGTSFSAPMVSALAAMAKQADSAIDTAGFKKLLELSAIDKGAAGRDDEYGYGMASASGFADALEATYRISFDTNLGNAVEPIEYQIIRERAVALPTPSRNSHIFLGWYDNEALEGEPLGAVVPRGTVGDATYYADWQIDNSLPAITSLKVLGIAAKADGDNYTVELPRGHKVPAEEDIEVQFNRPGFSAQLSKQTDTAWNITVAGTDFSSALTITTSAYAVPALQGPAAPLTGTAIPASYDGVDAPVPYQGTDDLSSFFETERPNAALTAKLLDCDGLGTASVESNRLTYSPAQADAGKTVTAKVAVNDTGFDSADALTVEIAVGAAPVSVSAFAQETCDFDLDSPQPVAVELLLHGNRLESLTCDSAVLAAGTHYEEQGEPSIGNTTLTLRADYLSSLAPGDHSLTATFDRGRGEVKTATATLRVTKQHTVSFYKEAGDQAAYATATAAHGATVALPTAPGKSGHSFKGWFPADSGTQFTAQTPVTADLKLYAKWEQSSGGGNPPGAGGGGGGVVAPAPTKTPATAGAVAVTFSEEGGTLLLSPTAAELTAVGSAFSGGAVIDLKGASALSAVSFQKADLANLARQVRDKSGSLRLILPDGTLQLDQAALGSLVSAAAGSDVLLSVRRSAYSTAGHRTPGHAGAEGATLGRRDTMLADCGSSLFLSTAAKPTMGAPVITVGCSSGLSPIAAFEGTVTLSTPYTLAAGRDGANIRVWALGDKGEDSLLEHSYDSGILTFGIPGFGRFVLDYNTLELLEPAPAEEHPFADIADTDWFYQHVLYGLQKGLFTGVDESSFAPNLPVTRGMMAVLLHRMAGSPAGEPFSAADVAEGDWYAAAFGWAARLGIVSGIGEGQYAPLANVTREQAAVMLYNAAAAQGAASAGQAAADLAAFADADAVSDWAARAMGWAVETGILTGRPGGLLDPQGELTRAEMAAILHRYIEQQ